MTYSVAVSGASGYAGGEILRILAAHPDVEIRTVTAHSNAGQPLIQHQPHLRSLAHLTLQETTPDVLAGHDIVFLALPHGQSGQYTDALADTPLVIDAGADHRLESHRGLGSVLRRRLPRSVDVRRSRAARRRHQAARAPRRRHAHRRPRLQREHREPESRARASPQASSTRPTSSRVLAVGPSGAGKSLKTNLLASEILGSANPYAVGGTHRHIPEIRQALAAARAYADADAATGPDACSGDPNPAPTPGSDALRPTQARMRASASPSPR